MPKVQVGGTGRQYKLALPVNMTNQYCRLEEYRTSGNISLQILLATMLTGHFWVCANLKGRVNLDSGCCSKQVVTTSNTVDGYLLFVCIVQVGYVIPGVRDVKACRVGDTWHLAKSPVQALPGFKPIKPMVFAGVHRARQRGRPGCV